MLFGSWARGRATVASDVDLLVVYAGRTRADAFRLVKATLDVPGLEPHVYSQDEYERLRGVLEPMTQDGVLLLEVEGPIEETSGVDSNSKEEGNEVPRS